MTDRNLFDSFNSRDSCFPMKVEAKYSVIDLTEDYSPTYYDRESSFLVRDELQSIDIFSDYEYEGLKQFRDENDLDSGSDLIVDSLVNEAIELNEFQSKIDVCSNSPNKLYTFRKLETKLPCLLIDKMESNNDSEIIEFSENEHKIPIQIEIDAGLPDLKKSEIITKQDLLRVSFRKSKPLVKEVVSFRLNSKRKQIMDAIPNKMESIAKNFGRDNLSMTAINNFEDKSIFEKNRARLKRFSLKVSSDTIKSYYLLVDVSHLLGLGIIEFICKFLNKVNYTEISVTQFNACCRNPCKASEIYFGNSCKNQIISFIEINENLELLFDNILTNNSLPNCNQGSNCDKFCLYDSDPKKISKDEMNFKSNTNIENYNKPRFNNASNKSVINEHSRRKQVLLPRLNNIESTRTLNFYHKNQIKILGILFDLQLLTELSIRNINDSGARSILEELEKPFAIIDRFISPKFISYQTILSKIKESIKKLYNQGVLLTNHLRILKENKSVSIMITKIDALIVKILNIEKDISSWQCSFAMTDSNTPNSSTSTISQEALRITIFSYQLIHLIKEFSHNTHQLFVSNSF